MSVKSPFKKGYSKYGNHESSDLPKMSEHLTDSNILQSTRTYGRKKNCRNLSMSSESSGPVPALNGKLCTEKNLEYATSVTISSYSKNNNIQKNVNSEFCLFNDEDTDYYFSVTPDSPKNHSSAPFIPEASSSGSNYQRTRKNLKNRLSNQQYNSEEISESASHEENSNSLADAGESKSSSDFLNLNQATFFAKQNSLLSINNQINHTKINGVETSDTCVNKLPQKSSLFQVTKQAGKISGKGTMFQNPVKSLINTNFLPILDLVNRFAASGNQTCAKSKRPNKRKRIKEECESTPAKKISVVKNVDSPKINSFDKKTSNSTVTVRKYSKNLILKSDIISTASNQDVKKGDTKIPSNSVQKDGNVERSVDMFSNVNLGALMKGGGKTPSKSAQKGNNELAYNTEKSIKMLTKYVSKNQVDRNIATAKVNCSSSSSRTPIRLVKNGKSDHNEKQTEKSPFSNKDRVQDQVLNPNINVGFNFPVCLPMIVAPVAPTAEDGIGTVTPLCLYRITPSDTDNRSIQNDNQAVSFGNSEDLAIPGPSTLNNDHSSIQNNMKEQSISSNTNLLGNNIITTTTTFLNKSAEYDKNSFRPRTLINDAIEFQRFVTDNLKRIEENCILNCKEHFCKVFVMNSSLLNITVSDFCNIPDVTNVLMDYLPDFVMDKSLTAHNINKGYDFPENFEKENLLRVVKDFVHTTISYIIPKNAPKPLNISYSRIIKIAMLKMSIREFVILMRVFKKTEHLLKLKDVLSRLSLVALLVIFFEYKSRRFAALHM